MRAFLANFLRDVRTKERPRFFFFCVLFGLLSFAQTLGLVGSESLFLAHVGSQNLAQALALALIGSAIMTVVGSLIYAAFVGKKRNDTYFTQMLTLGCVVLVACTFLVKAHPLILYFLFALYYITLAIFTNHFWTFAGDYFDTLSAKRVFPLFTVGASVGGLLGGIVSSLLNAWFGPLVLIGSWSLVLAGSAILIVSHQRTLRSWVPLSATENDETSIEDIRRSLSSIWHSPLNMWLLISSLSMILALFIAQFIYSALLTQAFPNEQDLAGFMSTYLVVTNCLEIGIELFLTPFLIATLGVARTNMVHPLTTCLSFLFLWASPGLSSAVFARANRELLENALAGPVRNLVYNALPANYRSRMRAFLEGVVTYSGMTIGGIVLFFTAAQYSLSNLAVMGGLLAALYLLCNFQVFGKYLETLVQELKAGRLDLEGSNNNLHSHEAAYLVRLWSTILQEDSEVPSTAALQLTNQLAKAGIVQPMLSYVDHPSKQLRQALAASLRHVPEATISEVSPALCHFLLDSDDAVCLESIKTLRWIGHSRPLSSLPGNWDTNLPKLLEHDNALVKASAAMLMVSADMILSDQVAPPLRLPLLDKERDERLVEDTCLLNASATNEGNARSRERRRIGRAALLELFDSSDPKDIIAAISVCDQDCVPFVLSHLREQRPAVLAACLDKLTSLYRPVPVDFALLSAFTRHLDAKVRRSTYRALGTISDEHAWVLLASGLNDTSREVRNQAAAEIGAVGEEMLPMATAYLHCPSQNAMLAAVEAIAAMHTPTALSVLQDAMYRHVCQAWTAVLLRLALESLSVSQSSGVAGNWLPNLAFMRHALQDAFRNEISFCFRILKNTENPTAVRKVTKELRYHHRASRAEALEILSNLGDRETSKLLVALLEDGPVDERLAVLPSTLSVPTTVEAFFALLERADTRWTRISFSNSPHRKDLMERLLVLRHVPLFSEMTLDQLEAINKIASEQHYVKGHVIFREGALGSDLFLVVEGKVRIVKDIDTPEEATLCVLGSGSYFGEMAILDDEPRSASVIVEQDVQLLTLDGDSLKELVLEMPEIAFEIFRVLTGRVRVSEQRVKELKAVIDSAPATATNTPPNAKKPRS